MARLSPVPCMYPACYAGPICLQLLPEKNPICINSPEAADVVLFYLLYLVPV